MCGHNVAERREVCLLRTLVSSIVVILQLFSSLVSTGGLLFEHYILSHGTFKDTKAFIRILEEGSEDGPSDEEYFLSKYTLPFWHNAIQWMHQVNSKCITPLGYWDSIQEYRGVSRVGRQLSSALGLSLPLRTYDRFKEAQTRDYERAWKELLTSNGGVMVCDNFNRNWQTHGLRQDQSLPYRSMNLTINAFQAFPDRIVNPYPFKFLNDTEIVPSVPSKLSMVAPYFAKVFLQRYFVRVIFALRDNACR